MAAEDPRIEDVRAQLTAAAEGYLGARKLTLDADAGSALRGLVGTAVETLASEDKLEDEAAIGQALANVERLVAQIDATRPRRRGRPAPLIGGHTVDRALDGLCPGFWPFC